MRQRSFEIIRKPELDGSSFLFNNVEVWYVGTCPETGISFYCSREHNYGVRVHPNGRKVLRNPTFTTTENSKVRYNAKRKQRYLHFANAFGHGKHILVSHAVWMAAGRTIPEGYDIDHINGCTTDNNIGNLRKLDNKINRRDGGFLTMLCNRRFDPVRIPRHYLLRYYSRMAVIKHALKRWRYYALNAQDLHATLYFSDEAVMLYYSANYNIQISFNYAK